MNIVDGIETQKRLRKIWHLICNKMKYKRKFANFELLPIN